jgi:methionyl aminopeptidase
MIPLKSKQDLETMRQAGKILAGIMQKIKESVRVGIATLDIDTLAQELINKEGAVAAFKGYKGYPATICTSVNEGVVHGIPSDRKLKEGDIISLDLGLNYKDYFSDIAVTLAVGAVSQEARKLIEATKNALNEGIKQAKANNRLSDISYAVQSCVEKNGFSVVRQFVGHGIGKSLHEEPEIPNFGRRSQGLLLKEGMVLAIEPMVNAGTWECEVLADGWSAVTKDGALSAHFEHTVAITDKGAEILTQFH